MRSKAMPNERLIPIQTCRISKLAHNLPKIFFKKKATHEPVKLSTKTRRTKSSIEYVILSKTTEQSGSVASCFSLPCISPSAAIKNNRLSIITDLIKKNLALKRATYVRWDLYPLRHLRPVFLANHEFACPQFESTP